MSTMDRIQGIENFDKRIKRESRFLSRFFKKESKRKNRMTNEYGN